MKTFDFRSNLTPAPAGAIMEVGFYDDIQDLPMHRLNEFQIHFSQDMGVGSTLQDWDKRMSGVNAALAAKDYNGAHAELYNSRLGLYLMLGDAAAGRLPVSTSARCLADLVYSVDGVLISDFTNEALLKVAQRIGERMSYKQVSELLEILKKKFRQQLKVAFPELFSEDDELTFYAKLVRRAKLQLADFHSGADTENPEIAIIDKWFRDEMQPENFDFSNPKNAVETRRRSFAQVCSALALHGIPNAELLTAYKFHSHILYIQLNKPAPANAVHSN